MKLLIIFITLSMLSACQTYRFDDSWPTEIPNRKIFIDAYLDKRGLKTATNAQLEYHLGWIKKFYQGTTLYPNGWLNASQQFVATINDSAKRKKSTARMRDLGIKISNEWAQDNNVRLINSANMATWASAMRTAAERNTQDTFLDKVEIDVLNLLKGKLISRDIKYERYFEDETYDDF